jgi:hypothetical protein
MHGDDGKFFPVTTRIELFFPFDLSPKRAGHGDREGRARPKCKAGGGSTHPKQQRSTCLSRFPLASVHQTAKVPLDDPALDFPLFRLQTGSG